MMITQGLWNEQPLRGHIEKKKKEQSQENMAGSKIYAEEKLQDIQLQRLCVSSLISVIKEQKKLMHLNMLLSPYVSLVSVSL